MSSKHPEGRKAAHGSAGFGLSLRLTAYFGFLFAGGMLTLFAVAYSVIASSVRRNEVETVSEQLASYAAWYDEGGLYALREKFDAEVRGSTQARFIRIVGSNGEALFFSVPMGLTMIDESELDRMAPGESGTRIHFGNEEKNVWTVASRRLPSRVTLQAGRSSLAGEEVLQRFRTIFATAAIPVLFLGIAGGTLLTVSAMRPIRQLVGAMKEILRTGDWSRRAEKKGGTQELNALVDLFNELLASNDRLLRNMREALDNVGHDLRTPMTRMRSAAEAALEKDSDITALREALEDCLVESQDATVMLNVLMELSEAEAGTLRLHIEKIHLVEIVRKAVEMFEFVVEEKRMHLGIDVPEELTVNGDATRLRQVFVNVIDNAIKYSTEGGKIKIAGRSAAGGVEITVRDEGVGISSDDLPRIWERLYRGDPSRSQRGLGLGLSMVRAVVEAHGGTVAAESTVGEGSVFTIFLPA